MPALRAAPVEEAPRLAAIYDPVVSESAISFEFEPPGPVERGRRIEKGTSGYPWLVFDEDDVVLG